MSTWTLGASKWHILGPSRGYRTMTLGHMYDSGTWTFGLGVGFLSPKGPRESDEDSGIPYRDVLFWLGPSTSQSTHQAVWDCRKSLYLKNHVGESHSYMEPG